MDNELHKSLIEKLLYQETLDLDDEGVRELLTELVYRDSKVKPDVKITKIGGIQHTCKSCCAFVGYLHEYCCECGQKLDWTDEED